MKTTISDLKTSFKIIWIHLLTIKQHILGKDLLVTMAKFINHHLSTRTGLEMEQLEV